jgi:predicted DsbA family dithiol-disulfide isomerase
MPVRVASPRSTTPDVATIEVFADVLCPFTHVGLRRLVKRRGPDRVEPVLHVRAWPLEWVNGAPLAAELVAEEVEALREHVAPDLFGGFDAANFPSSSLPALTLAAAAYRRDLRVGERVSLHLRDALFESGRDIGAPEVLAEIAMVHGLDPVTAVDVRALTADWDEGRRRGVVGSPHFFLGPDGFFCPSLDIARVDGHLRIEFDRTAFEAFARRAMVERG